MDKEKKKKKKADKAEKSESKKTKSKSKSPGPSTSRASLATKPDKKSSSKKDPPQAARPSSPSPRRRSRSRSPLDRSYDSLRSHNRSRDSFSSRDRDFRNRSYDRSYSSREDSHRLPATSRGSRIEDKRRSRKNSDRRISSSSPTKNKDRIRSSSPKPKAVRSSITVVSRHEEYDPEKILKRSLTANKGRNQEEDEEYDPESILKRSLVASKVQVARKPPAKVNKSYRNLFLHCILLMKCLNFLFIDILQEKSAKNKLLLRAVEDADKSIAKKRSEDISKATELEEIHRKRMKATIAARKFKKGDDVDDRHGEGRSPPKRTKVTPDSKSRETRKIRRVPSGSGSRRAASPSNSSSSSSSSSSSDSESELSEKELHKNNDLRARLDARKRHRKIVLVEKQQHQQQQQKSGFEPKEEIKMTIKNDQVEKKKHDDDAELELIRQRALNSMIRNQQQRRLSSEDKKIIIPLNEETSSDEDEEDELSLSSRDSHNRYVNEQLTQMQSER